MEPWTKTSRQFSTNSEREKRLIYLFWEKQWQKAFFDKRPGKILCDTEKGEKSAQREVWDFYAHMAHPMSAALQGAFVVIPEISHSNIFHIIKKDPAIGFISGASLHHWFDCVWSKEACCKGPCDRVRIGFTFAPLIWLCLKQRSIDLGAQTAQGMCEVQIVWIICTSSIPAGTALTKAISIYYIDSMLLVNYSLKIC